jgi:hypothetical protein
VSNFPFQIDSNAELPQVDDNITSIGGDAINALRSAMFAVESNIGINAQGSTGSIAQRLSVSLNPDGTIMPSALVGIGLVTLPITDAQISPTAAIQESKLSLVYSTSSLYTLILTLQNSIDVLNGFLSLTGVKLEPHIDGTNYNHFLSAIRVDQTTPFVKTNPTVLPSSGTNVINRNTTNADLLIEDISNDLVVHEKLDGSTNVTPTSGGTVPPINYAHMASGISVISSNFTTIPQSNEDIQSIIEYFDNSSLLLLGSRVQNLYANGISRTSRASSFLADGYGEPLVPPTPAIAYSLNVPPGPMASSPVDSFINGDDVILFSPTATQLSTFNFDAQFAQVQPGDLLTINYGTGISYQFIIDSTKSNVIGNVRNYAVRINGKNPISNVNALARIDKSTFHRGKYGVLASARSPNYTGNYESLIIASPRAAAALGNGFNSSKFDSSHYNLYLYLLPTGNTSTIIPLPAIDVTGNQGATPGQYTLDDVVNNINIAFRVPGFNYRFIAFEYSGQFGIMLADPYNNASFSIVSGTVDTNGNYTSSSLSSFPNNVVDNFNSIDPLGIGLGGANISSPPPTTAYATVAAAMFNPTLLFYPLKRNFFYTNGVERDSLRSDPNLLNNIQDSFGDGYWPATILPPPYTNVLPNRVEVVYQINLDLSNSGLAVGKTIVIQPAFPTSDSRFNFRDYGRFTIKAISFQNCSTPAAYTNITVYDGVHAAGTSPAATSNNIPVFVYFSDDSVSFDAENVFDATTVGPFKRFFEIYVDGNGHTFMHERARFINTGLDISNINLYRVSPKLRGYTTTNNDKEIRLIINNYDQNSGVYTGYLARWNPVSLTTTNLGPLTTGKKGEIVRFYDETNIDYIDFIIDLNLSVSSFSNKTLDIQLFLTLELDEEIMLVSSCQINDITKQVSYLKDEREFGNVSEEQFTSSALNYINAPTRLLNQNGVVNGFDNESLSSNIISFNGGIALINGNIISINETNITIPTLIESLYPAFTTTVNTITWFICANNKSEIELIASTDYSPSLVGTYGSLDQNRIFYVTNPASGQTYPIRGTYFSNLVSNYTDVAPLYIVTATVTSGSISSLSIVDARRFVSNGYSGITDSFILSSEGQFRTIDSLNSWISQFTNFISYTNTTNNPNGVNVDIRGEVTFTSPSISIGYSTKVVFNGNDGILNFGTSNVSLVNNITFSNIIINASTSTLLVGNNISFINCTINFPSNTVSFGNNISFTNCTITFPESSITFGTATIFTNCTVTLSNTSMIFGSNCAFTGSTIGPFGALSSFGSNAVINNCTITTVSGVSIGTNTAFNNSTITVGSASGTSFILSNNTAFTNCNITVPCAVGFTLANNSTFSTCNINYTYDATSDSNFTITNPASPAKACIFSNITTSGLENITIDSCIFTSPSLNRFPFISMIYLNSLCFAEGIKITNNKFVSTAANADDKFAVIAITGPSVAPTTTTGTRLNNCLITNNYCNKNQLIEIAPTNVGLVVYDAICTTNTFISNNSCGAINITTKQDLPNSILPNTTFQADKMSNLTISNNTCKYIFTGYASGIAYNSTLDLPAGSFPNNSGIFTGALKIVDNTCAFMYIANRVPATDTTGYAPVIIKNNKFTAYDTNFCTFFDGGLVNIQPVGLITDTRIGT